MKFLFGMAAGLQIAVLWEPSLCPAGPGEQLWKTSIGESLSSPAIASGEVFAGSLQQLYAINAANGQEIWRTNLFVGHAAVAVESIPKGNGAVEETAYVCSLMDGVQAFDANAGTNRWKILSTSDHAPAVSRLGVIYVSTDAGISALRKLDGTTLWTWPKPSEGDVLFAPAIGVDETVYFGSLNRIVYALDGRTGTLRWSFEAGHFVVASPAIGADGTVYIGAYDHKLYALNGTTGEKLWEFETGDRIVGTAAIGPEGNVYVGSNDKKMYALDGKTGVKKWEFETGGIVSSSPALAADGILYFGSYDRRLYALNAQTGTKSWEFLSGAEIDTAPGIGPDGAVYFVSRDGFLYAVAGGAPLATSAWPSYRFDSAQSGRGWASDRPVIKNFIVNDSNKVGFTIRNPSGKAISVQSSTNLGDWAEIMLFPQNNFDFPFHHDGGSERNFYRLLNP